MSEAAAHQVTPEPKEDNRDGPVAIVPMHVSSAVPKKPYIASEVTKTIKRVRGRSDHGTRVARRDTYSTVTTGKDTRGKREKLTGLET